MKKVLLLSVFLFPFICAGQMLDNADIQDHLNMNNQRSRHRIDIPDVAGYRVMKCDLHTHTVFSDGEVWPVIRVDEAWHDGLDAIAITDHIEYRPFDKWVNGDLNEAYRIAAKRGDEIGIMVIQGTEITRSKPLGHLNALFIDDANKLDVPEEMEAIEAALNQGAFIMWNHPGWPDNKSTLYEVHEKLLQEGKIHGIEIVNSYSVYPVSMEWCRDYNVTYLGNSDVHKSIHLQYTNTAARPINLVLVSDFSEEGLKEALFARRSIVSFDGALYGDEALLKALISSCLEVRPMSNESGTVHWYDVCNLSDLEFGLGVGERFYGIGKRESIRVGPATGTTEWKFINCFAASLQPISLMNDTLFIDPTH